jgi:hypothetical protein
MPIRFSLGLIAASFFAFRLFFAHLDIEPQAIDILKRWVSSEYVRYQTSRDDISLSEKAKVISQAQNIQFKSCSVRGKPERMVFRIEVAPNPAQPPNTPDIRYFRLDHSLVLGWAGSIPKRADAITYFLALFMV